MTPRRRPGPSVRPVPRRRHPLLVVLAMIVLAAAGTVVALVPVSGAGATTSWSPYGSVDTLRRAAGGLRIGGWAVDPSSSARSLTIYTTTDGRRSGSFVANQPRPDVAKAHRGAGSAHGFAGKLLVPEGRHTVCIVARNLYHGADTRLRCLTLTLDYGPQGRIDYVRAGHGGVAAKGYLVDGDAWTTPVTMTFTVDRRATTVVANKPTTEVPKTWPVHGVGHGFSVLLPTSQGTHTVCLSGRNIGYGSNNSYGCHTVTVDERPTGHIDVLGQQSGRLRLRGWAYDVDKPTTALSLALTIDGHTSTVLADGVRTDVARAHSGVGNDHGFDLTRTLAEGTHTVRVVARNLDLGSDRTLTSRTVRLNFTPSAYLVSLTPAGDQVRAQGWAVDPDTTKPIRVQLSVDGRAAKTVTADHNGPRGARYAGRNFGEYLAMRSGTHTICAVGLNTLWGTHNSVASCRRMTFALSPHGHFEAATRVTGSTGLRVTGWAYDPDTTGPIGVSVTVDGHAQPTISAHTSRPDIARSHPGVSSLHGFSATLPASSGEHRICLTARNVSGGRNLSLGCRIVNAVHPVVPSPPRSVRATAGYGSAVVSWTPPTSDGGAPVSSYIVHAYPGIHQVIVSGTSTHATVTGLSPSMRYYFRVWAHNVKGNSYSTPSSAVTTPAGPAPQRTPAPVATSRYIRNVHGSSSAELARMRAEGVADAKANPGNHRYLVLLDIGGQDYYDGGVVLSATTRFVSFANLVRDVNAYVDGYHSAQRSVAPVTIALGTNNDMDVSYNSGRAWATRLVNPVASHAAHYSGLSIVGADDIEPGFRSGYTATRNWLSGYLAGTGRPFVFNGSADGCAWSATNRGCNNGWTMARLYQLAAGAAPTRIVNLPQVYNTTMAAQWKYISLTGVVNHHSRINFGGPLTELTACRQSRSCGSLSGSSAWSTLWRNLQSDSRVRQTSMPYATDLRIDW